MSRDIDIIIRGKIREVHKSDSICYNICAILKVITAYTPVYVHFHINNPKSWNIGKYFHKDPIQ